MAFDQSTRNRLARFVSDARSSLTEEFTRQLQHVYGLDPHTGETAPLERLTALDDARRETARILREIMDYYLSALTPGPSPAGGRGERARKAGVKGVLERIVREQAFTVLNRLCALRMAESRGLALESVAKGYQSQGFQLYARLAGPALGETGEAYREYLFGLFDEFALDLPALFNRFSPMGRLFPGEGALLALLEAMNDPEIAPLWAEDETIGWIYQYFNSQEERKQMRAESAAPRNSRELAVRNQFFTPRYVVEFLTDNTLGRIWYEMTKGQTALAAPPLFQGGQGGCRYLVRRPNEIFLQEGEEAPPPPENEIDLTQEELLRQPVYIPHRPLKDPREIRMLDPACGSMHFGLYAFDLYEKIYAEAWELEKRLGPDALQRPEGLAPLHACYPDREEYLKDVPRLVIAHNIHGIDIDPRAVQIAGLSLWLRAHKSWGAQGLKPAQRPQIRKSNVVCAEPMPGDRAMLEEFLASLKAEKFESLVRQVWNIPTAQPVRVTSQMIEALKKLVRTVWDEMKLAGEAGSLINIVKTLGNAVKKAHEEAEEKTPLFRVLEYSMNESTLEKNNQWTPHFELDFFDNVEMLVLSALEQYTDESKNLGKYQLNLFTGDAIQGFLFLGVCRKNYDVILMNPPFGNLTTISKPYITRNYPDEKNDIAAAFIAKWNENQEPFGLLGAITTRTLFTLSTYEEWRRKFFFGISQLSVGIDLGIGVLDDAMVETGCFTTVKANSNISNSILLNISEIESKGEAIANTIQDILQGTNSSLFSVNNIDDFKNIIASPIIFGVPREIYTLFKQLPKFEGDFGTVKQGLITSDDFRFLRAWWEVPPSKRDQGNWIPVSKGGEYSTYFDDIHLYINWAENGNEIRNFFDQNGKLRSRPQSINYYFRPGLTYPFRSQLGFSVRPLPEGCIFTLQGSAIFPKKNDLYRALAFFNSSLAETLLKLISSFGAWQVGYVGSLPYKKLPNEINTLVRELLLLKMQSYQHKEESLYFMNLFDEPTKAQKNIRLLEQKIDSLVYESFDLENNSFEKSKILFSDEKQKTNRDKIIDILSYFVGIPFGRWDIGNWLQPKNESLPIGPFEKLPACSIAMLKNHQGLPATKEDLPKDYTVQISWNGILVDDELHREDIIIVIQNILLTGGQSRAESFELESQQILGLSSLRDYFRNPNHFFSDHIKRYSKSRRLAPIYWPLSTPSNSYTLWLYYHRLSDQTLYICVNDFVEPKLKQVAEDADRLRRKPGRTAADEKELERLVDFERELQDLRAELLRVAQFWKPNLNDGVQITAAPLWRLFQHRPWQKKLKETWEKLEAGEYDWAHLACSIWPERVRQKCKTDKSLAIAHDLEHLYVEPAGKAKGKKKKGNKTVDMDEMDALFDE